MKSNLYLPILLGVICGGLLVQNIRLARSVAATKASLTGNASRQQAVSEDAPRDAKPSAVAELTRLRAEEGALRLEVTRLRGRLGEALRTQAEAGQSGGGKTAQPGSRSAQAGSSNTAAGSFAGSAPGSERYVEAQMTLARERLNLSPDQELKLRQTVTNALQTGQEDLRKLLAGEAGYNDVPTQLEWAKALEDRVLAELTPEQQTAYQKYKQADLVASARLLANGELLAVQNSLGLADGQQDQMFAILYDHTLAQMDPDPAAMAARPRDPVAAAEWDAAEKRRLLQDVLTPAQLSNYQRLQDTQRDFLKGVLGRAGSGPESANLNPAAP